MRNAHSQDARSTQSLATWWRERARKVVNDIATGLREEQVAHSSNARVASSKTDALSAPDSSGDEEASCLTTHSWIHSILKHSHKVSDDPSDPQAMNVSYTTLNDALRKSRQCQKPVFFIDIEIPGDPRMTGYHVLSHPLIVEAAETLFVTVAPLEIYGAEHIRTRLLDGDGRDMGDRMQLELSSMAGMTSAMVGALQAYEKPVPNFLQMLVEQETGRKRLGGGGVVYKVAKQAFFGVSNTRNAEVAFAGLDGVVETRTGSVDEQQVVYITYNSSKLSVGEVVRFALAQEVEVIYFMSNNERVPAQIEINRIRAHTALVPLLGTFEPDDNSKYALRQTVLKYMPLTALQATRANRYVAKGHFDQVPEDILSPRQRMLLRRLLHSTRKENFAEAVDVPIREAWKSLPVWVIDQLSSPSFHKRRNITM